ncbi:hypothetical protein BT69DRAFT_1268110 [Atractiella rhizophila]|nr:hypothetical protein BT69DRAFT_1268110 [Atractiella rhizophila]
MASLRFCQECNNLLYPKADKVHSVLLYACHRCNYNEETLNNCVYRNDLKRETKENAGATQDLASDPTLPRSNVPCIKCGNEETVFFQDQSKRDKTRMILFHVCTRLSRCHETFQDPTALRKKGEDDMEEDMNVL